MTERDRGRGDFETLLVLEESVWAESEGRLPQTSSDNSSTDRSHRTVSFSWSLSITVIRGAHTFIFRALHWQQPWRCQKSLTCDSCEGSILYSDRYLGRLFVRSSVCSRNSALGRSERSCNVGHGVPRSVVLRCVFLPSQRCPDIKREC